MPLNNQLGQSERKKSLASGIHLFQRSDIIQVLDCLLYFLCKILYVSIARL